MEKIYKIFCAKVAGKKKELDMTNEDIAKATGYTKKTIDAFTCGSRPSKNVAKAISKALDIEM